MPLFKDFLFTTNILHCKFLELFCSSVLTYFQSFYDINVLCLEGASQVITTITSLSFSLTIHLTATKCDLNGGNILIEAPCLRIVNKTLVSSSSSSILSLICLRVSLLDYATVILLASHATHVPSKESVV